MEKETVTQVKEVQRAPGRINPRRNMSGYIVIILRKIKDKKRMLKETREKQQAKYSNSS